MEKELARVERRLFGGELLRESFELPNILIQDHKSLLSLLHDTQQLPSFLMVPSCVSTTNRQRYTGQEEHIITSVACFREEIALVTFGVALEASPPCG
jgi:hypothetical protein